MAISRKTAVLRTADVARRAGYSVQQIRNLERDGVLRPASRSPAGYRIYSEQHVAAAQAYRAIAAGTGPVEARQIMRAAHGYPTSDVLRRLDAAHARLDRERRDLTLARQAVQAIATEPLHDARPADAMSISELAGALGVRPSTLRHWDAMGLVVPRRADHRSRTYTPDDVRDARIVHQLRLAGYRISALQTLMPVLRQTNRWEDVTAAMAARDTTIDTRSRALLDGAAALVAVLSATSPDPSAGAAFSTRPVDY